MDREKLDLWCERGILGLVLTILVFGPLATGAVRTLEFLIIQGLTVLVLVLWIIRFWVRTSYRFLWPPIYWAVLAFVGYAIVRYQYADIEYVARQELIRILIYAFLFGAILDNLNRQESVQLISKVLVFLAMAISVYALYQFLTGSEKVWHFIRPSNYTGRGSGTYICPNHLAGLLEMVLPLALALLFLGRDKPVMKVLLGYAALVILAGLGVTLSRAGWVSAAAGLLVFFGVVLTQRGHRIPAIVFFVLVVAGGYFFVNKAFQAQRRVQAIYTESGRIADIRVYIWESATDIWRTHFWFGGGPGHFDFHFRRHRPPSHEMQFRAEHVHNDYLHTLVDYGVVGLALIGGALALLSVGVVKTWKFVRRQNDLNTKPSKRSTMVVGAACGLIALAVHSLVDFNMHIPANAIIAITLMAILTGHLRYATESYWVNPRLPGTILATIVLLCGVIYLGQQTWIRAREYVFLEKASQFKDYQPEKLVWLEKAFQVEPKNWETAYRIGEYLRLRSWERYSGYQDQAKRAMTWFEKAMVLNPLDPYAPARYGMCLHWLGRYAEAAAYFHRGLQLDPNSYYMSAMMGWHYFHYGDFHRAKRWFERSRALLWNNELVLTYLPAVEERLAMERAVK
ncbi:MAG: O-antigen ligase family protein [Verrucomicrobiota bacterium]